MSTKTKAGKTRSSAPAKKKKVSAKSKGAQSSKASAEKRISSLRPLAGKTLIQTRDHAPLKWHVIDLKGQSLGRAAATITRILRGKHVANFHPSQDLGDCVIALNAAQVKLSGKKIKQKIYYRHSGYLGHLKQTRAEHLMEDHPDRIIRLAVKGMLPPTHLGRKQLTRLFIYSNDQHPHKNITLQPVLQTPANATA